MVSEALARPTFLEQSLLDEIVRRILGAIQPRKIILFGSAATGKMTPDSDIDLLLVVEKIDDYFGTVRLVRSSLEGIKYPFDILLIDGKKFDATKTIFGGIAFPAYKYGKVLYESKRKKSR